MLGIKAVPCRHRCFCAGFLSMAIHVACRRTSSHAGEGVGQSLCLNRQLLIQSRIARAFQTLKFMSYHFDQANTAFKTTRLPRRSATSSIMATLGSFGFMHSTVLPASATRERARAGCRHAPRRTTPTVHRVPDCVRQRLAQRDRGDRTPRRAQCHFCAVRQEAARSAERFCLSEAVPHSRSACHASCLRVSLERHNEHHAG